MRSLSVVLLTITLASAARAEEQDATELWVQGNAAFKTGDYDTAVARYEALLALGVDQADVHYNLGNARLRAGRIGKAIAAYLEARRLAPRDEDVRANLAFARQSVVDAVTPPEPSTVLQTLFFWYYGLSRRELATALIIVNVAFWTSAALFLVRRSSALRWIATLLGLALLALAPALGLRHFAPGRLAVVQSAEAAVHAGIGADSVVRFRLHEGVEAEAAEIEDDWVRILLSDGKQGWVARADVALVTF